MYGNSPAYLLHVNDDVLQSLLLSGNPVADFQQLASRVDAQFNFNFFAMPYHGPPTMVSCVLVIRSTEVRKNGRRIVQEHAHRGVGSQAANSLEDNRVNGELLYLHRLC